MQASREIEKSFECPITLELLTEAVRLSPCQHKVNESAAKVLYGEMKAGKCEKKSIPCPVCRNAVSGYSEDMTIRQLSSVLLGKGTLPVISVQPNQFISEIYDQISEIGGFIRSRLRLFSNGKFLCTAGRHGDLNVINSCLSTGSIISAIEMRYAPYDRVFPSKIFVIQVL